MSVISKLKQLQAALKEEESKETPDIEIIKSIKAQIMMLGMYLTPADIYNSGM
jgi:hypothetical protein